MTMSADDLTYTITRHCRTRMAEMNVSEEEIEALVYSPEHVYTSPRDGRMATVHQRGNLAAVIDHQRHTVVTVLLRNNDHRVRWDRRDPRTRGSR
jgi:hypothetical protein